MAETQVIIISPTVYFRKLKSKNNSLSRFVETQTPYSVFFTGCADVVSDLKFSAKPIAFFRHSFQS